MLYHRQFRQILAFLLVLSLFTACQPVSSTAPNQPKPPLVVLIDNDEGPITPANFNTFIGFWMIGWVYDPLFTRSPSLEPIPALASAATPSADGLSWEITLREGVKWHDGQPFTAKDVVFSYNFLREAGRAPNLNSIESMEATSDHSLTIKLSAPAPFFLNEGLANYYIMPEHIWKDQKPVSGELSQFQGQIGTGAFKLVEVTPGEAYTFAANPDYFRGPPRVATLIAKIVKDRTQQFNQLRTGAAAAVLANVPPALVGELSNDAAIKLQQGTDYFTYVYYLNGSRPPFDQIEVRRALASTINTAELVETITLGMGRELPLSLIHPELPYSINLPHQYDPEAAKKLLDEAGVTDSDGDGVREFAGKATAFSILCDVNNPVEVRSTELIKGWLAAIGIGAEQKCIDIDTAVSLIWPNFVAVPNPDYDMAFWGWSSGPQVQRGFIRFLVDDPAATGWANLTGMSDAQLNTLIADFVSNPDLAQQAQLNQQIQERFAEVLPFIPLMSPGGNFAYRPADYDGWVYTNGTGIMPVWSFLPPEAAK